MTGRAGTAKGVSLVVYRMQVGGSGSGGREWVGIGSGRVAADDGKSWYSGREFFSEAILGESPRGGANLCCVKKCFRSEKIWDGG